VARVKGAPTKPSTAASFPTASLTFTKHRRNTQDVSIEGRVAIKACFGKKQAQINITQNKGTSSAFLLSQQSQRSGKDLIDT
jgi:hypothetical protein